MTAGYPCRGFGAGTLYCPLQSLRRNGSTRVCYTRSRMAKAPALCCRGGRRSGFWGGRRNGWGIWRVCMCTTFTVSGLPLVLCQYIHWHGHCCGWLCLALSVRGIVFSRNGLALLAGTCLCTRLCFVCWFAVQFFPSDHPSLWSVGLVCFVCRPRHHSMP